MEIPAFGDQPRPCEELLPINVFPVADPFDSDNCRRLIHFVKNSVIPDPYSPEVVGSDNFSTSGRKGISRDFLQDGKHGFFDLWRKFSKTFFRLLFDKNLIHRSQARSKPLPEDGRIWILSGIA